MALEVASGGNSEFLKKKLQKAKFDQIVADVRELRT
jgi:hypothetical protein